MKLVAHLVRADVRRFRLLLAGWVLIEIADTVFTGVHPFLIGDSRTSMTIGLLAMVLFFTRWLGMIAIVALVVQTHPLVGSDAFWMTRPIAPRTLLVSKLVLLGAGDKGRPLTVFVSSHDIQDLERLANWIGFIDRGRLIFAEPVASLLARYSPLSLREIFVTLARRAS